MPANRMAVLQCFTLEGVVVISVSMLDRFCNRVKFLRAFALIEYDQQAEIPAESGPYDTCSFLPIPWQTGTRDSQVSRPSRFMLHAPCGGGILRSARKVRFEEMARQFLEHRFSGPGKTSSDSKLA